MKFKIHVREVDGNRKGIFRIEAQTWCSVSVKANNKLMNIKADDKSFINWRIKAIERETSRSIP